VSSPTGPAAKTERLLNLVLCLLYTRRALPKSKIREIVPQYGSAASDEAFDRMFERDKDELRELGIPLVTEDIGGVWDDELGYRIDQRDYALPDIEFEADELAVLGLASRTWAHASLAGPAASALRKLKAIDIERDGESLVGIEPRLGTREAAFEPSPSATAPPVRARSTRVASSRGGWPPGTAAGTSPGTTSTAVRRACSACPASKVRSSRWASPAGMPCPRTTVPAT
jgi:hypothetical protein